MFRKFCLISLVLVLAIAACAPQPVPSPTPVMVTREVTRVVEVTREVPATVVVVATPVPLARLKVVTPTLEVERDTIVWDLIELTTVNGGSYSFVGENGPYPCGYGAGMYWREAGGLTPGMHDVSLQVNRDAVPGTCAAHVDVKVELDSGEVVTVTGDLTITVKP